MLAVKTAISVDKTIFDEAEYIAKEMHVSRSKLYVIAMKEFIDHRKNKQLFDDINAAYSVEPSVEEQTIRKVSRQQHKRIVEREW